MEGVVFDTITAYVVQVTTVISDQSFDLEVKGQCQIYIKSCLRLEMQPPLILFANGFGRMTKMTAIHICMVKKNLYHMASRLGV